MKIKNLKMIIRKPTKMKIKNKEKNEEKNKIKKTCF